MMESFCARSLDCHFFCGIASVGIINFRNYMISHFLLMHYSNHNT